MKTTYIVLFLTSFSLFSQEKANDFIGAITHEFTENISDEKLFDASLKNYLKIKDSVHTATYLANPKGKYTSQYSSLEDYKNSNSIIELIFLDPRNDYERLQKNTLKFVFGDSTISIKRKFKHDVVINKVKETYPYRYYSHEAKGRVIKSRKYSFSNKPIQETIVYKDSTKIICGIKCYKVIIVQKGDYFNRKVNWNHLKDSKIITEMYITEKIKAFYHPIVRNKEILRKYYPLEVKRSFSILKGYSKYSIVSKITNSQTSFKKIKKHE